MITDSTRESSPSGTLSGAAGKTLYAPTRGEQRTARIMGGWFLLTFVFSIPAFFLYEPILDHADYVRGGGHDTQVAFGLLLEIGLAVAGIATAVVIFPIVKRVNESVALGYIASRTVESILIIVGVLALMTVIVGGHEILPGDGHETARWRT